MTLCAAQGHPFLNEFAHWCVLDIRRQRRQLWLLSSFWFGFPSTWTTFSSHDLKLKSMNFNPELKPQGTRHWEANARSYLSNHKTRPGWQYWNFHNTIHNMKSHEITTWTWCHIHATSCNATCTTCCFTSCHDQPEACMHGFAKVACIVVHAQITSFWPQPQSMLATMAVLDQIRLIIAVHETAYAIPALFSGLGETARWIQDFTWGKPLKSIVTLAVSAWTLVKSFRTQHGFFQVPVPHDTHMFCRKETGHTIIGRRAVKVVLEAFHRFGPSRFIHSP